MSVDRHHLLSYAALALGIVLFIASLFYVDLGMALETGRRLGRAVPLALLASGLWHLARTWAWSWCFQRPPKVGFARLTRVRLAAEAFSYLTVAGVAGEPLKVVLLRDRVPAREATAAVALERLSYMIATTIIVGAGAAVALWTLPLTAVWFKIFRAFAIVSAALAAATALIIIRQDSYLLAALRKSDRALGTHVTTGRVARFIGDVGRQVLELVRGNRARLVVLTLASLFAYACMSAEVWLILHAVGVPVSVTQAVAIETFSRVASFASAFIPANLGALEISSIAAVAAVGAQAAGAPLALARRLRGLFWAAVGLAIYPRRQMREALHAGTTAGAARPDGPVLLYLPSDPAIDVSPLARIAGLPIAERVFRSALRARYTRVIVLADDAEGPALGRLAAATSPRIEVHAGAEAHERAIAALPRHGTFTAIGAGSVPSPALLADAAELSAGRGAVRDVPAGDAYPVSGVVRMQAADARDLEELRARLRERVTGGAPQAAGEEVSHGQARLSLRIASSADLPAAERTIRRASYKDTDNKLARLNRRVSVPISVALIRTPLTANQLSVALVALGFYSAWLFSLGAYLPGALAGFLSLAASVLDGCDGEIARLKYQESALGCWIETFGDYSYYIAIFVGLTIGAVRFTGMPIFYWLGAIALAGTLITFALLIFLRNRITAGRPERLHAIGKQRFKASPSRWSRIIWRISFVATRSAMPYGIFALSLVGLLPLVVALAAIGANTYWISLALKMRHLLGREGIEGSVEGIEGAA